MYIKVRARPGSKKEKFERKDKNTFIISTKEPAKNNLANKRILEIISLKLEIPLKKLQIINGHHSPSKLIKVRDESR